MSDAERRTARIFSDGLGIDVPDPEMDIVAAGLLDSLALVTLLFEIECEFGVTIPLENLDIDALRTLRRIASLVDELVAGPKPAPRVDAGRGG